VNFTNAAAARLCALPTPNSTFHATVLQLYRVEYESATGPITSIAPMHPSVPVVVQKQTYRGNTLASSTGGWGGARAWLPAWSSCSWTSAATQLPLLSTLQQPSQRQPCLQPFPPPLPM
jgi:hypothetical protein